MSSLHSLSPKKKKTSTTNCDHTVPSCPRQTNPGSPFPRTDFWRCAPKRWNASDAAQKSAESLSEACIKKGGNVSLTLFVVPQFLVRSLTHVFTRTHIRKLAAYSVCTNSITPTKSAHTPTSPRTHTHTLLPWELQASVTSKHLQCDKNSKYVGCYWAALSSDGCVSPRACSASVSSASGGSCGLGLQRQTK